jgi:photosystem II stability/assembly factor-like uncharacterized protein
MKIAEKTNQIVFTHYFYTSCFYTIRYIFYYKEARMKRSSFYSSLLLFFCTMLGVNVQLWACGGGENPAHWALVKSITFSETTNSFMTGAFLNEQFGLAVSGVSIFKTRDGGSTWIKIGEERAVTHSSYCSLDIFNENIFTVGQSCLGSYLTNDGGRSFIYYPQPAGSLMQNYINPNVIIVSDMWEMFRLENNGQNRPPLNLALPVFDFKSFSLPDENTIFILTKDGKLVKSVDSGKTWQTIDLARKFDAIVSEPNDRTTAMRFTDAKNGSIVTFSAAARKPGWFILSTTNAGENWEVENLNSLIPYSGSPRFSRDGSLLTFVPFAMQKQSPIIVLKRR